MDKQLRRLRSIGVLITNGHIVYFRELFDHVEYKAIADVMQVSNHTLNSIMNEPEYYPTGFFISLAAAMEVEEWRMIAIVWNQYRQSLPAIAGRGRRLNYKRYA